MIDWLLLLALIGALSAFLTGLVRRYALAHMLIDVPNARSSHSTPTPRGGGMAIIAATLLGLVVLALAGATPWSDLWALAGAGGLVAVVGLLDDRGHVAVRWRLLAHFAAATLALAWLGGAPPLPVFGTMLDTGWIGAALIAIYLIWILNLFNFMDGIDGIAAVEAICVCLGGALVAVLADVPSLSLAPLVVAAAAAGFLLWNFPPAKIFMGDVGSGFLGIVLGVMSLQAGWKMPQLFWCWAILLGAFVVDATVTLLRRLGRGDRVYEAHRSHAYQYAARRFGSHRPVTLAVPVIDLLWLLPIASLVATGRLDGAVGLVVAYMPLVVLVLKFRAGEPEPEKG